MRVLIKTGLMSVRGAKRENLTSVVKGNRYDGEKISNFCNFEYTPLTQTIERVVKAYRQEKRS